MAKKALIPGSELLDETIQLTLYEVANRCHLNTEVVIEMVYEGVIDPRGQEPQEWRFSGRDLARLNRALRLRRDLQLNMPGVALAIDLLEEVERLHSRVRRLERRIHD